MFTLSQLTQITSLTERTLRSYLASGILQGKKENGRWLFSEEEVDACIRHPAVAPGIQAKGRGIVFDFLNGNIACKGAQMCVLLDRVCPREDAKALADFFCAEVKSLSPVRFSYSDQKNTAHFILEGRAEDLTSLMAAYGARP